MIITTTKGDMDTSTLDKRAEMQLMLERQAALEDEQDIEDLIAIGAL